MAVSTAQESLKAPTEWSVRHYLALGISFANLCLLRRWKEILTYTKRDEYFMKLPPAPAQYYAAIANVILIGLLVAFLAYVVSRIKPGPWFKPARIAFLILLAIPLNALREAMSEQLPYLKGSLIRQIGETEALGLFAILGVLMVVAFIIWPLRIYTGILTGLLIASPFVLVTFSRAVWEATHYDPQPFLSPANATPVRPAKPPDARVVWIIFDELDERLAFDERPDDLKMPELDRFRQVSVHASNAIPPSSSTSTSLPSLITGQPVSHAYPNGPSHVTIEYAYKKQFVSWESQPNIFTRVRQMGLNAALGGWYHPYCRLFGAQVMDCEWHSMELLGNTVGRTFIPALPNQLRSLLETSLYSPFGQSLSTAERVRRGTELFRWANRVVADPLIGFVFVHFQVPHAPFVYDRRTGRFDRKNSGVDAYVDALAQVDLVFGELRRSMEQAKLWDRTTVLVSSDHWYRSAKVLDGKFDRRVPFLLKLPAQTQGAAYGEKFSTILSQQLLDCILNKKVSSPQQVLEWLDQHRGDIPPRPV